MSQPDAAAQARRIRKLFDSVNLSYIGIAVGDLLPIYEFVITFDQEVATAWSRNKLSFATILLVSTRWCFLASGIINILPTNAASCKPFTILVQTLEFIGFAQVALFSALRASAIWCRNYTIFFVVLTLGMTPAVLSSFQLAHLVYAPDPSVGCYESGSSLTDNAVNILTTTGRVSSVAADAIVLFLTWVRTYQSVLHARKAGIESSLSTRLARDGTIYFLTNFVVNLVPVISPHTIAAPIFNMFLATIPPIVVSRFMMNLRRSYGTERSMRTAEYLTSFSAPRFRVEDSIFESFAEPVSLDAPLPEEEDVWRGDAANGGDDVVIDSTKPLSSGGEIVTQGCCNDPEH